MSRRFVGALLVLAIGGCGESDGSNQPDCPASRAQVDAGSQLTNAVDDVSKEAGVLCRAFGQSLGLDSKSSAADACAQVRDALNSGLSDSDSLTVSAGPLTCWQDLQATRACLDSCVGSGGCEQVPTTEELCTHDLLSTDCSDTCEGTLSCAGTNETPVACAARCGGLCDGTCEGECVPSAVQPDAATADCRGACEGTCTGNCFGACVIEPDTSGSCEGPTICAGNCDAEPFGCGGEIDVATGCADDSMCADACLIQASITTECTTPGASVAGQLEPDVAAALEAHFGKVVSISGRLHILLWAANALADAVGSVPEDPPGCDSAFVKQRTVARQQAEAAIATVTELQESLGASVMVPIRGAAS